MSTRNGHSPVSSPIHSQSASEQPLPPTPPSQPIGLYLSTISETGLSGVGQFDVKTEFSSEGSGLD